jgi:hypothetical protein
MLPKPSAQDLAEARKSKPVHQPATAEYRESWSVLNPRGSEVCYGSYEEALAAAQTGIY